MTSWSPRQILTIAGSDSGGGAGIQADLKTFFALGCHGLVTVTALTAQNTCGVRSVRGVGAKFVAAQLDALAEDFRIDAIKIGMLWSTPVMRTVRSFLEVHHSIPVVLDPVMVAKGGSSLLRVNALPGLRGILEHVSLLTPNLSEAEALLGNKIARKADMEVAAERFLDHVPNVVVKGGHLGGTTSPDYFASQNGERSWIEYPRIRTRNTHGTGCTFSAAVAAFVGRGVSPAEAVREGRRYLQQALIGNARRSIGRGKGPVV